VLELFGYAIAEDRVMQLHQKGIFAGEKQVKDLNKSLSEAIDSITEGVDEEAYERAKQEETDELVRYAMSWQASIRHG